MMRDHTSLMRPGLAMAIAILSFAGTGKANTYKNDHPTCTVPSGWNEVEKAGPKFVVFGELHGTREAPLFVANLACSLAKKRNRILVAIENQALFDDDLQRALALDRASFKAALTARGWAGRNDGIASEAMFNLLETLHELKQGGHAVDVVYFSGNTDKEQAARFAALSGQGPGEAAMAENIDSAAQKGAYAVTLVLTGNFHARKANAKRGDVEFAPMAKHLTQYGKVLSLDMVYAAGSSWNCQIKPGIRIVPGQPLSTSQMDCGAHAASGITETAPKRAIELFLHDKEDVATGFDGTYWVGPISASDPLLP